MVSHGSHGDVLFDLFLIQNNIQGVREGTIAAALLVGMIVSFYNRKFTFLARWIEIYIY